MGTPFGTRSMQETVPEGGLCNTMIPPSPLAPDDSTCWQWYTPPSDGVLPAGAPKPPTGCDYGPCEAAVCECDSYCCDTAWDLSCRGYYMKAGDTVENNYFVPGCSAKLLCCEQESAFPDPPIGAAMAAIADGFVQVNPAFAEAGTSDICVPGSEGCCDTMIPPSFLPPDDSTCWQWWDPPADGVMTPGTAPPPKGCNYKPCEAAVCACDPYCCETAWDLSCRGYHLNAEDTVDNNYFVDGCSAKMLCCEPESAYPDPPVGGALPEPNVDISQVTSTSTATSTETSTATSSGTSTATLSPTVSPPIATTSPTMAIKSSKKGSKGKKGSKKGCKGKGKAGKAGKAGKKGSSAGTKMPKSSTSKGSKSKGSKSSKCPDPTSAPTPPVGSPTVSPTATTTSTSTSTSTTSLTTTATSS